VRCMGKEYTVHLVNRGEGMEGRKDKVFALQKGMFVVQMTNVNRSKIKVLFEKWLEKQAAKLFEEKGIQLLRR
jgi:hypothetical protein